MELRDLGFGTEVKPHQITGTPEVRAPLRLQFDTVLDNDHTILELVRHRRSDQRFLLHDCDRKKLSDISVKEQHVTFHEIRSVRVWPSWT